MALRLNLGCGPVRMEGETGVDMFPSPNTDVVADITKTLPFSDCAAEFVRLDHVLEHVERSMLYTILREVYRILEPNGTIVVGVPDMSQYFEVWLRAGSDLQMKNEILTGIYGGQMCPGEYHKTGFDKYILKDVLETAGFEVESIKPDEGPFRTEGFCITAKGVKKDG